MSDPNTAPKGINREALSRLDSEVEEWNRRRAEREATAAVKFDDETESKLAVCPPDLAAALRSFGATLKAAAAEERAEPEPPKAEQKGQLVLFPQWADTRRATAQAVFRSALFPAMNNKQSRCYLEQERIASVDGVTVFFTGKQFDQSDLDVYLELLQVAHVTPFGVECTFTAYGLLKALGRATGNKDHKRLHSELIRLRSGTVDMTDHGVRYFGGLIEGGIKDEITRHYRIRINPDFARFFKAGMWASLDIQQRRDLGRNQTAKALHAYYSTHTAPAAHRYETLAELVGLKNTTNPRKQKADIIKGCEALKRVGLFSDYEAGAETIKPTINQTPSQTRHIVRKVIKARRQRKAKGTA